MNLNKISLIAAVAALMLTGCNNDLVLQSEASDKAIEFRTVMDKTRASLINNADELTSFFLHAGASNVNGFSFMDVAAYRTGTHSYDWEYAPKKYWPGYSLDFFAYAPIKDVNMTNGPTKDNTLGVTFSYKVPFDQSKSNTAVDLLVAYKENVDPLLESPVSPIELDFEHALSSVIFSAVNIVENLVFTIHSIEITNLYNTGKYSTLPVNGLNWSNWDSDPTPENYTSYIAGIPESGVAVNRLIDIDSQPLYLRLLSPNDYMMVLPQKFLPSSIILEDVAVKVVYSAIYGDGRPVFDSDIIPEYVDNKATVYFSLSNSDPQYSPINNEFKKGCRYNFKFKLGGGYGEPDPGQPNPEFRLIELDVDVQNWEGIDYYNDEGDDEYFNGDEKKGTDLSPDQPPT